MDIVALIKDLGFPIAVVIYMLWDRRQSDARMAANDAKRDAESAKREKDMATRLREVEDFQRGTLLEVIKENTVALRAVLSVIQEKEQEKING